MDIAFETANGASGLGQMDINMLRLTPTSFVFFYHFQLACPRDSVIVPSSQLGPPSILPP